MLDTEQCGLAEITLESTQTRVDISDALKLEEERRAVLVANMYGGDLMDWNRVEGNWMQVKGKVKEKWGQLTDDDLDVINGRRDQLEGKIQQRYGLAKDQVARDVDDWVASQRW